jgi:hypothetical protein
VDRGERVIDAAVREAREEAGSRSVSSGCERLLLRDRAPVIIVYHASMTGGCLGCDDEGLEARFFQSPEIPVGRARLPKHTRGTDGILPKGVSIRIIQPIGGLFMAKAKRKKAAPARKRKAVKKKTTATRKRAAAEEDDRGAQRRPAAKKRPAPRKRTGVPATAGAAIDAAEAPLTHGSFDVQLG